MMDAIVDLNLISDCLTLGGVGLVAGVCLPLGSRLVAYVIDGALLFTR